MRIPFLCLFFVVCFLSLKAVTLVATFNTQVVTQAESKKNGKNDSIVKKSFIKKILSILSFKRRLQEKDTQRIEGIVKTYFLKDSVNLAALGKKLENYPKIDKFDSLVKILKTCTYNSDNLNARLDSLSGSVNDNKNTKNQISDKDIQAIADKVAPLVKQKAQEEEADEQKNEKIRLIRQILSGPRPVIDTLVINDSVSEKFQLSLKKRELFGFHPYWMNKKYFDYNFSLIGTLAYYGYELNATGDYISIHGWDSAEVISKAKKEGCKVQLVVYSTSTDNIDLFLKNELAQKKFFNNAINQLKKRQGDGINVMLGVVDKGYRVRVTNFIKNLARKLKSADSNFSLTVTVPCLDINDAYDVEQLQKVVDYFIIDFTKKNSYGPIAPIKGEIYSLESGLNRYLSKKASASKFIVCLPYHGARWDYETQDFVEYVPYETIVSSYTKDYGKVYDKTGNVRIDVTDGQDTLEQLWYDDEKTLSKKYDYVSNFNIRGIGVWALGDDDKHPELWDALLDKLVSIDTTNVIMLKKHRAKITQRGLWAAIRHELKLYKELFQHPCHFKNAKKRKELKSEQFIGPVTCGLAILLALVSGFSIFKTRTLGEDWEHRKLCLTILVVLLVLVVLALMMFCFLNPNFYYFGTIDPNSEDCETSFGTILTVLGVGVLVGSLAMKFLVVPLLKPKEVP